MTTIEQAVKSIETAKHDPDLRITRRIEVGHCVQQGDVYIHHVADNHRRGKQIGVGSVQIALGAGNGARHMAEGAVEVFEGRALPEYVTPPMDGDASEILGPVVVAKETWLLTHPEHPHHRLPAGCYQVTYQFDPQTMRRVVD